MTQETGRAAGTGRRIVVGVDGSPGSEEALRWATGQAGLTGARVEAVSAWQYPMVFGFTHAYVPDQGEILPELTRENLDKTVAAVVGGKEPGVEVVRLVVQGHAAEMLLRTAAGADLLVLGSHGHGTLAGMLLGSITQHCVHHAPCPVVVVPSTRRSSSSR